MVDDSFKRCDHKIAQGKLNRPELTNCVSMIDIRANDVDKTAEQKLEPKDQQK